MNDLALIPLNSLFNIFNHKKRNLTDHNLAYNFISEMSQTHDISFSILLNSLDGNELTDENLQDSLDKKEDHLGFMPLIDKNTKIRKIQKVTIHTSPEGFNGLLNNLLIKTKNNIKNEVIIQASSKNTKYSQGDPEMVVDYNNKIPCQTQSVQNSWIQFIFINNYIIIESYRLRSCGHYEKNFHHPKTWILQASFDGENWETIDEQKENQVLNGPFNVGTFNIEEQNRKPFQFVKLVQTGCDCNNGHYLTIDSIEFFGSLILK